MKPVEKAVFTSRRKSHISEFSPPQVEASPSSISKRSPSPVQAQTRKNNLWSNRAQPKSPSPEDSIEQHFDKQEESINSSSWKSGSVEEDEPLPVNKKVPAKIEPVTEVKPIMRKHATEVKPQFNMGSKNKPLNLRQ